MKNSYYVSCCFNNDDDDNSMTEMIWRWRIKMMTKSFGIDCSNLI